MHLLLTLLALLLMSQQLTADPNQLTNCELDQETLNLCSPPPETEVTTDSSESSGIHVDLRNPTYKYGALYTNEGGTVRSDNQNLRIQAKSIQYIHREDVHTIEAEGDLLIQYKGRAFVGSELEYDFNTKTGTIYDGKTFASYWFVGGDAIHLNADGSYTVDNATITTCENQESTWDIHASSMKVIKGDMISTSGVRFRLFKVPVLWLPSFKVNLKKFADPVFNYELRWDSGLGPRISTRYQLYSWQDFAIFGRLEYRWATGWGGALETEYHPTDFNTHFVTRSYIAKDRLVTATEKMQRYRIQGDFKSQSQDDRTLAICAWDKYSDVRMPNDFKSQDFEINPGKTTILYTRHRGNVILSSFKLRPRANPFESIKQDLPTLFVNVHPLEIGHSGVFSMSSLKASYLDFVYSNQLTSPIPSYHSPRIELREKLYRPIHAGPVTLTPYVGGIGIFYGNSPSSKPKWLGVASYGARAEATSRRFFTKYQHQIQPYAEYTALSHPTVRPDSHYTFSIQDGYDQINRFRIGLRNLLHTHIKKGIEPRFIADLYGNAFFADRKIPQFMPYGYLDLFWRFPSVHLTSENAWNFREHTLQYSNARLQWTVNENIAISLEGRYRSRFDWRKADHDNFILDVTRSQSELLQSPLSDQRVTFLTDLFIRLTPLWECRIQSHHGFLRLNEKPYNEVKIDLFTWISASLKCRLSFCHSADRGINSVSGEVYLVKSQ